MAFIAGSARPEKLFQAIDHRSDQFTVAMIFWELLTGRGARARDPSGDWDIRLAETEQHVPPSMHADRAQPFDDFILRSLSRDPQDRFPDFRAFRAELQRSARPLGLEDGSSALRRFMNENLSREGEITRLQNLLAGLGSYRTPAPILDLSESAA